MRFPHFSKQFLPLMACFAVIGLLTAGCGRAAAPQKPPGDGSGVPDTTTSSTSEAKSKPPDVTVLSSVTDDGFLTIQDLSGFLPDIRQAADQAGYAAELTCPDPDAGEFFLCVADDTVSAQAVNGFFYLLSSPVGSGLDCEPLILGLDRLFPESGRDFAISGGQFSEKAVTDLLELTLRQILADDYQAGILDFILSCYRTDFENRLASNDRTEEHHYQEKAGRIEVNYHASIFSTVVFRILQDGQ